MQDILNIKSPSGRDTQICSIDSTQVASDSPAPETGRRSRRAKLTAELKILGNKAIKSDGKTGRWSPEEHIRFLQGLKKHGKEWKLVCRHVNEEINQQLRKESSSRTGPQVRSHAQKFFKRITPMCLSGEKPVDCLIRTNFAEDVIICGIEDNEEKLTLISLLKNTLDVVEECDCQKMISPKTKASKKSISISEKSDNKVLSMNTPSPEVALKSTMKDDVTLQTSSQKFSYFPSSYKMSTEVKEAPKAEVAAFPTQGPCFNGFAQVPQMVPSCVQLQPEAPSVIPNKRKHSEMVRYEKLEKMEESPFNIPHPREQFGMAHEGRMNKRVANLHRRQRIMTADVGTAHSGLGFLPINNSEQTLSSIEVLRNSNVLKPQLGSLMKLPQYKMSMDDCMLSNGIAPNMSNSRKKAAVKLLKKDRDMNQSDPGFNRLRLQTY